MLAAHVTRCEAIWFLKIIEETDDRSKIQASKIASETQPDM